ncbi:MarR family transcriptional regulator [Frondihabitans sp. PAMC 28766]|uniref:MarR family winged helix-turn-helix transcriptional regulator n=1 Tax=Frondihabitans sp. PAMC 28766 TaxID=1795630 RepID=UPI00078E0DFD|nr:MarR family transcriptional regulator [Frondihabitans sp. PAMC 28766]AMM21836.1 MarR family transcriptional regulator [Frondihabitans sp. PAMC 28766]
MARSTRPLPLDPIAEARRQWNSHGWTSAADGMAAVTSIMRAQQLMLARVEAVLKPYGLSFARYEMLTLLSFTRDGVLPMASATARLQVHPTSVTNTVDRLEKDALVTRSAHPSDGRAALLTLTDAGRALVARASSDLNAVVFEVPGLERDDLAQLVRILGKFRRDAGDFDIPDAPAEPL